MKAHENMILNKKSYIESSYNDDTVKQKINYIILLLYLQMQINYSHINLLFLLPQLVFHLWKNKNPLDSKCRKIKITEKII